MNDRSPWTHVAGNGRPHDLRSGRRTLEFWVVMLGELRWTFEGDPSSSIVASQGDIVYAPPKTWHVPQFWGKTGLNCRLTSSTYPSANHLYDPAR